MAGTADSPPVRRAGTRPVASVHQTRLAGVRQSGWFGLARFLRNGWGRGALGRGAPGRSRGAIAGQVKFLIDAQLPPALARWLRDAGHEAATSRTKACARAAKTRFGRTRCRPPDADEVSGNNHRTGASIEQGREPWRTSAVVRAWAYRSRQSYQRWLVHYRQKHGKPLSAPSQMQGLLTALSRCTARASSDSRNAPGEMARQDLPCFTKGRAARSVICVWWCIRVREDSFGMLARRHASASSQSSQSWPFNEPCCT